MAQKRFAVEQIISKLRDAEDTIDGSTAYRGGFPDLVAGECLNRTCEHGRLGKIELMHSTMNRIDIDGGGDVEACLFEPEAKASCSGK